jgi:hypothetical protein
MITVQDSLWRKTRSRSVELSFSFSFIFPISQWLLHDHLLHPSSQNSITHPSLQKKAQAVLQIHIKHYNPHHYNISHHCLQRHPSSRRSHQFSIKSFFKPQHIGQDLNERESQKAKESNQKFRRWRPRRKANDSCRLDVQ